MEGVPIRKVVNDGRYNEVDVEKSEVFLESLQAFVIDAGLVDESSERWMGDGDTTTFYTLFYEDPKDDFQTKRRGIDDFEEGEIARYSSEDAELLVVFLRQHIKVIFYCDPDRRARIMGALLKFCRIMEV